METEVMLPRENDHQKSARVVLVSRKNKGQIIRKSNHNPMLNTKLYKVMLPHRAVHQYAAKTIADNIYSQMDEDCQQYQLMEYISNNKSDYRALPKSETFIVSRNGNMFLNKLPKDGTCRYNGRKVQTHEFH